MQDFLKIGLVLVAAGVLYYLVFSYYKKKNNMEYFANAAANAANVNNTANNSVANNNAANNSAPANNAPVQSYNNTGCQADANAQGYLGCQDKDRNFEAYDPVGAGDYQMVGAPKNTGGNMPKDCFPKDQLAPSELLPANVNSQWSQVNPSGQGKLGDQNFLSAGYHFGTDTVGQSLRNANRQLRSEPPNPQVKVSPWQQSSIEPDINRRPLEIGGC